MRRHPEHSEFKNTDDPALVPGTYGNRIAHVPTDAAGYACGGGWTWTARDGEDADTHQWLVTNPGKGLEGVEVVWPTGWPRAEWGRGVSVLEYLGPRFLDR